MIVEMAAAMAAPDEVVKLLQNSLDLSVASDEQVDGIYKGLIEMLSKCSPKRMTELVQEVKAIQN